MKNQSYEFLISKSHIDPDFSWKGYVTELEIEVCLNSWIKSKLAYSTLNRNYANTITWLVAQIRSACKGVEILEHNIFWKKSV